MEDEEPIFDEEVIDGIINDIETLLADILCELATCELKTVHDYLTGYRAALLSARNCFVVHHASAKLDGMRRAFIDLACLMNGDCLPTSASVLGDAEEYAVLTAGHEDE